MPDSPIRRAALEVEAHVGADGWDQPARLFSLVPTTDLVEREPHLADRLGDLDGFTPVEQEIAPDQHLEDLLLHITWPDVVVGCAVVVERLMLPPEAEDGLPDDPDALLTAVAEHPDRREVRLVAAVERGGAVHSGVRARLPEDAPLLEGPDLVPVLVARLRETLQA